MIACVSIIINQDSIECWKGRERPLRICCVCVCEIPPTTFWERVYGCPFLVSMTRFKEVQLCVNNTWLAFVLKGESRIGGRLYVCSMSKRIESHPMYIFSGWSEGKQNNAPDKAVTSFCLCCFWFSLVFDCTLSTHYMVKRVLCLCLERSFSQEREVFWAHMS